MLRKEPGVTLLADHRWIEFEDRNGHGFAQPDFLLGVRGREYLLEVKRSATGAAVEQLLLLYRPLVEMLGYKQLVLIQVALNTVGKSTALLTLDQVLTLTPGLNTHLWNWRP